MTQRLHRSLSTLTLACWSGILLYFHLSGRISAFLHPAFRPGVLISGIVLLLFAIGSAIGVGGAACCGDNCGGHHATQKISGKVLAFLVLLLPLAVSLGTKGNGFGITAIENRGVTTEASGLTAKTETSDQFMPKTASGAIAASVIDLLYAAQDPTLRADFEGKTVEIVGQLMGHKGPSNAAAVRMKVVRMYMTCCAADAKPIAALIELPEGAQKSPIAELSWVRVVGKPVFPTEGGRTIAVLKADSLTTTAPPEETMLY